MTWFIRFSYLFIAQDFCRTIAMKTPDAYSSVLASVGGCCALASPLDHSLPLPQKKDNRLKLISSTLNTLNHSLKTARSFSACGASVIFTDFWLSPLEESFRQVGNCNMFAPSSCSANKYNCSWKAEIAFTMSDIRWSFTCIQLTLNIGEEFQVTWPLFMFQLSHPFPFRTLPWLG